MHVNMCTPNYLLKLRMIKSMDMLPCVARENSLDVTKWYVQFPWKTNWTLNTHLGESMLWKKSYNALLGKVIHVLWYQVNTYQVLGMLKLDVMSFVHALRCHRSVQYSFHLICDYMNFWWHAITITPQQFKNMIHMFVKHQPKFVSMKWFNHTILFFLISFFNFMVGLYDLVCGKH